MPVGVKNLEEVGKLLACSYIFYFFDTVTVAPNLADQVSAFLGVTWRRTTEESFQTDDSKDYSEESAHLIRQVWRHRNCIKKVGDI